MKVVKEGEVKFYKRYPEDQIWWVDTGEGKGYIGKQDFSFDKKKVYSLYADYPWELSEEEKAIFDKEYPEWAEVFRFRTKNHVIQYEKMLNMIYKSRWRKD